MTNSINSINERVKLFELFGRTIECRVKFEFTDCRKDARSIEIALRSRDLGEKQPPGLTMFLMYYEVDGKRVYTFAKTDPNGNPTKSAHPGEYCNNIIVVLKFKPKRRLLIE